MSSTTNSMPDVLSCILSQDAETKLWLGHCLDFDLVTSAKTQDGAWQNLKSVITTHVEHCFTHHKDGLKFRASKDEWNLFGTLKNKQPMLRQEKITLRLVAPPAEQMPAFWIAGVESSLPGEACESAANTAVSAVH
jgi:predicted RNase H-like HicB family nuclease